MKKLVSLILALLTVLSMTACGSDTAAPTTGEPAPTNVTEAPTEALAEPPTEAPTEAPAEKDTQMLGTVDGSTYTNKFLGIQCQLDENWLIATDEELAQLSGLVADAISDEVLAEQLNSSGVVHAFYATSTDGFATMNIVLENLGLLYGTLLSEETYVEIALGQLPAALESAGLENVTAEAATATFAGEEHAAVAVHGTISGLDFYEKMVCIKADSYIGIVTVGCYYEDITDTLLDLYSPAA